MSKDKTTMNTEDKGLNNSVSNGNQSTSSQAQSQRDYENLINKSLDEQITDVSISRADITNPNLHYGIEEEAEKIDDFVPQATKKESKLLSDVEKPLTETTERQTSDQNQKPIEELQTKELVGNDVPQTPGELASPNTPKGTDTPSTIAEGETTPENTAGNDDDPNEETGTPVGTTSGEETETFNPDLVTTGNSVDENAAEGTVIATLNLEDADGSVFVYFISDANGLPISNSNFKIVGNELVVSGTANLDFESLTSHNIFITAIDGGGNKVTEPFTININDVNEFDVSPITDTDATANSVTENASIGTSVGITAFASDDDGTNNGITYSLSNDAGGLFAIDPNTGEVTVAGAIDYETATSQTIEVTATSEDGSTSTQSFTININDVDEFDVSAISDTDASTNSVAENASIGTSVGITAFASDADGSNNGITYSLSNDAGGLFAIDPNTGEVTVAGAIDYETATSQTIEVTATSEDGSTSTQSFTININDVDEFDVSAITDTDSTANSVTENSSIGTSVGITAFASDADGSNNGITYSLSDDAGGLFAIDPNTGEVTVAGTIDYETATSQTIEVTATSEDGSTSTQSFTININDVDEFDVSAITDTDATTNSVAENAAIGTSVGITAFASDADGSNNGITYSLSDDASGLFTIDPNTGEVTVAGAIDYETATSQTIEVTATSEDGSTSTQSFTINVTDVDEFDVSAITDTDSTANSVTENASIGTSVGITAFASDADGSNNGITYSLSDDAGGLFAIDPNTGEVTVAGSIDYETATSQTIEVTATSEDGSTSTQSFTINVTDVDEFDVSAITDTNTDANAVDEDASVGTTVGITALATDADGTDTVTYSLSDDAGGLFTIDANTGVVTVASGLDAETATSHNITVVATSTDGSTSNETFTISVNDVNETSISAITDNDGSANSVSEGAAVGTAVGITALATDADVTDTVTYSLSSNPGGFFAIDANTGVVTVASGLDFETNEDHTIEVTATSSDGTTSTETFTIDVTDVDEFDVSAITDTDATTNSVAENSAVGTSVGITAFASDADGSNNGITYSLSDDAGGLFAIDPNTGEVTVAGSIDYEKQDGYKIEVTATSDDGSTSTQEFKVAITDVDEFDVSVITDTDSTANSVSENASIGTSVGITAFASDADGTNNDITYSLSNDAGGLFTIDPNTGEVTVAGAIDYETATSQTIEVTATSEDGSTSTQSFTINITDVDEFDVSAITDTNTDANEVDEDASVGAVVGITALATDADGTDTVTYSLSDDAGGLFTIDANTGVVTVASSLDAETATSHNITVVATSTDGSTSNETFTIGVNDVNETNISAISDTDSSANSVSEGAAVGTAVGITALATDADVTDTVTYSLSSNPGGFFAIDANTGVVTVASGLDFETNEDHTIEVTATSSDGTTSTQNFTIDVTDVDEFDVSAITDTDTSTNSVTENAAVGTSVGITAFASDADGSNNGITYSLSDDAGGLFAIDPNTGEVTVAGAIDYETATSQTIEVTATSEDGSTSTQTFTVNIENANEGPTDITFTGGTVNETVEDGGTIGAAYDPSGTTVATLSTTDEDAGETFTYAITNDPSGHFEIVGNEVRVKAGQTIDYETATSHDITIEVTDSNGSTYSETITINVEDYEGSYTGANNADTHTGTSEEDTVSTGGGSDTIIGSDGADSIDGGTGKDTVDYSGSTEGVTVNFETGQGTGGQAEGDTYTNVENVIGSDHDDFVKGSYSEGTTANLGAGDDKFDNTQGYTNQHDVIDAGAGNDTVYTGDGNDSIDGGTGNDQLFGEGGNDTILGGDGDDSIRGGAGDDIITGGAGDDTIIGDEYLGTDNDTVVYTGNWADYTITQSGSYFTITDNRPGSPDGTDTVHTTIENFQFADATVPQADILNDAPTDITVSGGNIDENGSDGTVVATLGVTDADSFIPSETATYSITNDPSGNFEIVGNEVRLKAGSSLDFETDTTHDITVQVTDVHGATYSETITINVNDIDEFDVSAITDTNTDANAVDEDASVGSIVGITALATDADGSNNSVTYSLSDDAGGLFTIDANTGVVTVASGLDAETATSHNITVVATSSDGSTSNETFTINVNDINETSISAIADNDGSANSVSESASVGTAVGITALATDADVTDTVTYSLSSNPGGFFAIDANTGVVTVASGLDFETNEDHTIEVTATSTDGTTSTETFTIDVTDDTSEASVSAITDTDSSANTVAENTSVGTSVGITAFATDADGSDNVTYSLSDDAGGLFAIDPNTGEVTVAGSIDYETATSQTIEVTATSDDGSTSTQSFTINVTDVDEFDVSAITDTDATANSVAENANIGTSVGITAFASDADGTNNGITYSLSDDAGGLFAIDPNTGEVTVAGSIDYENQDGHKIEVTATSDDGSTSTQEFKIAVTDVDEFDVSAITDTNTDANAVDEDASVGTTVGITALATDADGTDTVTYSLSDDAGGLFTIDANTGVVTVASGLDAETATSHNITVVATSTDGSTSNETFTINVNDVNETSISAISDTNSSANSVSEGAAVGTAVGITALATDADVTDAVTYSLSSNPGGFFAIDANTGVVTVASGLDFETNQDHTIEVTATSTDGTTSNETFTIDVTDVNEFDVSAITDTDATANSVAENTSVGTSVGITAFASDDDGSNNGVTYSINQAYQEHSLTATSATSNGWGGSADGLFNDNFNYDPTNPTEPMPEITWSAVEVGLTSNLADGQDAEITFALEQPFTQGVTTNNFTLDIYGRKTAQARDDNFDIEVFDENGSSIGTISGLGIPDGADPHLRVDITDGLNLSEGQVIGSFKIIGHDSDTNDSGNFFSLMEIKAASEIDVYDIDPNTGEVTVAGSIDYEASQNHTIEVTATSDDGSTSTQSFTINVTDIDEFDVSPITDTDATANEVNESAAIGTTVGITALATDADGSNNSVTYSLSDDAGGLFTIDANTGVVTVASGLDAETATSHNITVVATSSDGSTSNETFTINVNDVNETSISAITDNDGSANSVSEGASVGTAVGITALATDADVTDTVTYSLSSNPGGFFAIDANTGVVTVASGLDFETNEDHTIEVTATSTDGTTSTETFTIDVTDVDEFDVSAITDTNTTANSVNENAAVGTSVGITAFASDADGSNNGITYSLSDDAGGLFAIDPNTGEVTVAGAIDYETATSQTIEVTATSEDGSTSTQSFSINVNDLNEAPVAQTVDLGATNEDTGIVITEAQLLANSSDVDAGTTLSITALTLQDNAHGSLTDNGNGTWTFNPTGDLSVNDVAFNFTVSDGTLTDSSTATIDVTAVADAPTLDLSTTSQDITTGSTTLESGFEGDTAAIGATGNNGFVGSMGGWMTDSDAIEVKTETLGDGSTNQFIELNNDAVDYYEDATNIYQEIDTTDGGTYTVDFNFAPRPGYDATINQIEVLVDGVVVKTISADGSSDSSINWQTDSITFTGDGTPARIEFREAGVDQNYGRGMYMDNISISEDLPEGHANGMENTAIALPDITAATTDTDGSETLAITITSIPEGAVLTDGTNTFTATVGDTNVDVTSWQLDSITMTPPEDFSGDITLTVNATATDGSDQNTTSSDISITVHDDDDTFTGTATEDLYNGGAGDDTINGNDGNDWLLGGEGDDTINGGNGDDVMTGGAGDDEINGGSGADTVVFSGNLADYSIAQSPDGSYLISDLRPGSPDGTDLISNVESFEFADQTVVVGDLTPTTTFDLNQFRTAGEGIIAFDDRSAELTDQTITGTSSNELLVGGAGNDTITAGGGDDDAAGKNGKDRISGGDGDDIILGGNGNDILSGDAGNDAIDGGKGTGDTAEYSGNIYDYTVTQKDDGSLEIRDDRPGSPDGTDVVNNVEFFQFADITVTAEELVADDFDVSAISDTNRSTNVVTENASVGTAVGITALATDDDVSDNVTYSLSDDAGGLFAIDENTGEVTVAGTIDYEKATNHEITVVATSKDGSASKQSYTINVNDQDEFDVSAITDTDGTANTVTENVSVGTSVGITASASDADGSNNAVTYSLSDDAGGLFTIDPNTGEVTTAGDIDYETATSHTIEITATSSDGSTSTQNYTINVEDVAGQTITGTDLTSTGGDTGSINTSNYSDTSSGYTVSAKNVVGGALTTASAANISTSGGLGANGTISDSDSGQASQLGYDKASGLSEELIVDFDNAIDSANFSFANLYSSSHGEVGHWAVYDNGTLVAEGDFTESSAGTGSGTISINPEASFDQLIITGKLQTDGTDGSDFVVTDISYNEVETITGGNDTLTGTTEDDKISGLTGDDVLTGGDGNDTIYGGSSTGVETTSNVAITNASFESANLGDGSSTGNLGGWTDVNDYGETFVWDPTTSSFTTTPDGENVLTVQEDNHVRQTLSESFDSNSDYELSFSVGNPMSTGSGDSWSVSIYSGNTLIGSASGVEPAANAWQDVTISIDGDAYAAADGGALRIDIQNTETYTGSGDYIAFDNFELTKTSEINDGADTIYGGAGDDTINYGTGGDTVYGGDGNDTIDDVSGGTYNYNDTIDGGAGNDTIWSGGGDDTITGGAGNDWIDGEDGNDLFIFQEGDGNDTIYGGAGGGWTDTIQLQDEMGGSDLGVYGTDWTVTLTEGTIQETNADNILFSDDADGTITLEDGSSIDFTDIERIDW